MFRCMVDLDVTSSIDNDHFLQCTKSEIKIITVNDMVQN